MENDSLVLDLLEWLGASGRPYEDVMDAWRTSCPRLTIWEDALEAGLLAVREGHVFATDVGRDFLGTRRSRALSCPEERCVT